MRWITVLIAALALIVGACADTGADVSADDATDDAPPTDIYTLF